VVQRWVVLFEVSGGEGGEVVGSDLRVGGGDGVRAAARDQVRSEVVAPFGPLVGLLGQDRADEADDGLAGREDRDGVSTAADSFVQPLGMVR